MIKTTTLDITVVPKSSRSEIKFTEDNIKVYLNSPPAEGKANVELIKLISKKIHVSKSSIKIVSGEKSRQKRISIEGFTREDILKLLKG